MAYPPPLFNLAGGGGISGIVSARCGDFSRRPGPEPTWTSASRGRL